MVFTKEQEARYAREMSLPEIGREGVERLLGSSVLVVGAGALGCITAMYLAAAGVGRIGVADFDTVGLSNLQRQLSYTEEDIGRPKADTLAAKLKAINSEVEVEIIGRMLTRGNIAEYVERYDVIVEGSDNPSTKYLVSDTARAYGKPCVIGGVRGFVGQVTTQLTEGSCYRDIFPDIPEQCGLTPCSTLGVIGPVPGVIASLQATEVIKLITGVGQPLSGRLLQIDTLTMSIIELHF
ncbi:MAG: HesA/MoeB/ThiF family protein [Muribaculaceae bacterium]|nr:HesA/MoeB/ThiF family protein [Muribaculaceae bacterium]